MSRRLINGERWRWPAPQAVLWFVKVGGKHFRTIWRKPDDERAVQLIDQRFLPHEFVIEEVRSVEQMATAIREMHVRGADSSVRAQDTACISRPSKLPGEIRSMSKWLARPLSSRRRGRRR